MVAALWKSVLTGVSVSRRRGRAGAIATAGTRCTRRGILMLRRRAVGLRSGSSA